MVAWRNRVIARLPDAAITLSPEAQERLQSTVTVLLNKPRGLSRHRTKPAAHGR